MKGIREYKEEMTQLDRERPEPVDWIEREYEAQFRPQEKNYYTPNLREHGRNS